MLGRTNNAFSHLKSGAFSHLKSGAICLQRKFISEIFISRLSYYTTDEELRKAFSPFGDIREARLIRDGRTRRPKGYAFVAYASEAEAQKAVKAMDGRIFGGRLIFVELAKSRLSEDDDAA